MQTFRFFIFAQNFSNFFKNGAGNPFTEENSLDPMQPSNYRPISKLSTISKILERVVFKRLSFPVSLLRNFNLFQSAYHSHHSTETAILYTPDSLHNICATGSAAVLVSLYIVGPYSSMVEH